MKYSTLITAFTLFCINSSLSPQVAQQSFKRYDRDNDGILTKQETLEGIIEDVGDSLGQNNRKDIENAVDVIFKNDQEEDGLNLKQFMIEMGIDEDDL